MPAARISRTMSHVIHVRPMFSGSHLRLPVAARTLSRNAAVAADGSPLYDCNTVRTATSRSGSSKSTRRGQPGLKVHRCPRARPDHPGNLVPPRQPRVIQESRGEEEGRPNAMAPQDAKRDVVVVPIAVIEGHHDEPATSSRQHVRQVVRGDHIESRLQIGDLVVEVAGAGAPDVAVQERVGTMAVYGGS